MGQLGNRSQRTLQRRESQNSCNSLPPQVPLEGHFPPEHACPNYCGLLLIHKFLDPEVGKVPLRESNSASFCGLTRFAEQKLVSRKTPRYHAQSNMGDIPHTS